MLERNLVWPVVSLNVFCQKLPFSRKWTPFCFGSSQPGKDFWEILHHRCMHLGISFASMWKYLSGALLWKPRRFISPKLSSFRFFCSFGENDSFSMAAGAAEQHDFPKEEENILKLWEELDAFQSCLRQSKDKPRSEIFTSTSFQWAWTLFWSLWKSLQNIFRQHLRLYLVIIWPIPLELIKRGDWDWKFGWVVKEKAS